MRKVIPYGKQYIDQTDIDAVAEVLKSDFLTTGPKVGEFEKVFADYVGSRHAVAVSNGTAALHIACLSAGIGVGDEVITTPITFAASANCALYCGATPVFADIDPRTYNIDPNSIRDKITDKTRAIIPVDYTGQPCDMDEIQKIADEYGLIIIEDGAHSIGAKFNGKSVGSMADMTTFSFHPVKHITTGEGGMVTTDDRSLYEKLKLYRAHGITRDINLMEKSDPEPWYYEQLDLGYNYRISDIQSALGITQLEKLKSFIDRRREIVEVYEREFGDLNEIITPYQDPRTYSSYHLYIISLKLEKLSISRREFFEALRDKGIGVNVHYIPVYYLPYYQRLGYKKGLCPLAEDYYETIITLPLHSDMTDEDVDYVVECVKGLVEGNRIKD